MNRQTTGFNDFSIDAGILLRGIGFMGISYKGFELSLVPL
jgi:hypothetical protein